MWWVTLLLIRTPHTRAGARSNKRTHQTAITISHSIILISSHIAIRHIREPEHSWTFRLNLRHIHLSSYIHRNHEQTVVTMRKISSFVFVDKSIFDGCKWLTNNLKMRHSWAGEWKKMTFAAICLHIGVRCKSDKAIFRVTRVTYAFSNCSAFINFIRCTRGRRQRLPTARKHTVNSTGRSTDCRFSLVVESSHFSRATDEWIKQSNEKQKSFEQTGQSEDIMDLNWTGALQWHSCPPTHSFQSVSIGEGVSCVCVRASALCVACVHFSFYYVLFKPELLLLWAFL